jgi:hypothetical protein
LAATLGAAPEVLSVAVLGSVARDEAVLATVGGRAELFSDIELLVVTAARLAPARRAALQARAGQTASAFGHRSRRFHLDLLFRERARLGHLPPFVFTYELAANGRTVFGRHLLSEVRAVTPASLDRANTHEILVKRLWHLAEDLPAAWIHGQPMGEMAARDLGVALWRHPLDIPTALLPESGVLLPTYARRVARWSTTPCPFGRDTVDAALGADSAAWLAACLARRSAAAASPDPRLDHAQAMRGLAGALAALYGVIPSELGAALAGGRPGLLRERPLTRGEWWALARQLAHIARSAGAAEAGRWWAQPRKGRLGAGLLALHEALVAHGAGDAPRAAAQLRIAVAHGRAVGRAPWPGPAPEDDFAAAWLAARAVLGRAFWRVARLGEPAAWPALAARIDWLTAEV